jgi:SAM-dependent methyltransferase
MPEGWEWDETLYKGSAPYYARGRLPYAPRVADELAGVLALDGHGRMIDVGCGPGTVTLTLAHLFDEAVGVDPDAGMLAEAESRAAKAGIHNVRWVKARGEDLPFGLGTFRVATFAQSFHWMDRPRVAAIIRGMLEPGGTLVHVSDVKEDRPASGLNVPHPRPPYDTIRALVRRYLGPVHRAGQGLLRHGTPDDEAAVLSRAGYTGPIHLVVPAGDVLARSADDIVAWVFSLSGSAPHLFGNRLDGFEADLRHLLRDASPEGLFAEPLPDTEVFVWRTPRR